jgi:hypothetical protein
MMNESNTKAAFALLTEIWRTWHPMPGEKRPDPPWQQHVQTILGCFDQEDGTLDRAQCWKD